MIMSQTPKPIPANLINPTPDDLAGIPACADGPADLTVRPCKSKYTNLMPSKPLLKNPTPDDLAGIPACADGPADLTVKPRTRK
jgi:hypothetical protein